MEIEEKNNLRNCIYFILSREISQTEMLSEVANLTRKFGEKEVIEALVREAAIIMARLNNK